MGSGGEGFEIEVVEELLEEFNASVLRELESEADEAKRYLKFLAWLNRRLEEKGVGRIIITGASLWKSTLAGCTELWTWT